MNEYRCTAMQEKYPAVYIMASRYRGKMYVGVTSALYTRVCDHKNGWLDGHTHEYGLKTLVWYAHLPTMEEAIRREKLLKKWHRDWKFRIIEAMNRDWKDLHESIDANIFYGDIVKAPPRPACIIPGDCHDGIGVCSGIALVKEMLRC